jgi:hypothetical protein
MKALARMRRLAVRRRDDLDGAVHETRRADALEIKIAGEVVAPGPQRLQRWIKLRLGLDKGAGRRRHAAANGEPHALRLPDNAVALDPRHPQHEAVGFLALLAQFDNTGEPNAIGGIAQQRMGDQRGLDRGNETCGYGKQTERDDEGDGTASQQHCGDRDRERRGRPPHRPWSAVK